MTRLTDPSDDSKLTSKGYTADIVVSSPHDILPMAWTRYGSRKTFPRWTLGCTAIELAWKMQLRTTATVLNDYQLCPSPQNGRT